MPFGLPLCPGTAVDMWNSRRGRTVFAAGLVAVVTVGVLVSRLVFPGNATVMGEVEAALERGDATAALKWTSQLVSRWPDDPENWARRANAGSLARQRSVWLEAIERVEASDPTAALELWIEVGSLEMQAGLAADAELCFRRAIAIQRSRPEPWRLLSQLISVQGRPADTAECLLQMIRLSNFSTQDLTTLAWPNSAVSDLPRVEFLLKADPDNLVPMLAFVGAALNVNDVAEAERVVERVLTRHPEHPRANALLGLLLANRDAAEFSAWIKDRARFTEGEVEGWLAKGIWLRRRERNSAAARMFHKAMELDPRHLNASSELGLTLRALGQRDLADELLHWAQQQQEIVELAKRVTERADPAVIRSLILKLEEVGRLWEAWAWCRAFTHAFPDDEWGTNNLPRLKMRLADDLPRTNPEAVPGRSFDWSRLDEPDWTIDSKGIPTRQTPPSGDDPDSIVFVEEAAQKGIDFRFVNGVKGRRTILQTSGGGSAAFDFDRDGWCDLHFTQGGGDPLKPVQPELDVLYRNDRGERFRAVTSEAFLREDRFSQGTAAGDMDGDGFADLFIANYGQNRLYRNLGDGTFEETSGKNGLTSTGWTTSAAMADLDGDGDADLYLSRYAGGPDVATRECTDHEGRPGVCRPTLFPAEGDLIALGRGDGSFEELSTGAGLNDVDGRGFGVVVDDFNDDGLLDVFVANDQTANFLWIQSSAQDGPPRFVDEAVSLGAAFDRDGFPQACMGVASGDVNGDGRTDLSITNFQDESNTLYVSQRSGGFEDRTREAELRDASFPYLGFGTQFLDADLDGRLDLLVLNGHILDQPEIGRGAALRPQLFQQIEGGRFRELKARSPEEFLARPRIGRGLTVLDWNRDGRPDFAASYLEGSAGLGTNSSRDAGQFLEIELAGVNSARDAIGAVVGITLADGEERIVRLTSGDGFAASNERVVRVGLGTADVAIREITIRWPSGRLESHADGAANRRWLAVEGRSGLTRLQP